MMLTKKELAIITDIDKSLRLTRERLGDFRPFSEDPTELIAYLKASITVLSSNVTLLDRLNKSTGEER